MKVEERGENKKDHHVNRSISEELTRERMADSLLTSTPECCVEVRHI